MNIFLLVHFPRFQNDFLISNTAEKNKNKKA